MGGPLLSRLRLLPTCLSGKPGQGDIRRRADPDDSGGCQADDRGCNDLMGEWRSAEVLVKRVDEHHIYCHGKSKDGEKSKEADPPT